MEGIKPPTDGFGDRCSTTELHPCNALPEPDGARIHIAVRTYFQTISGLVGPKPKTPSRISPGGGSADSDAFSGHAISRDTPPGLRKCAQTNRARSWRLLLRSFWSFSGSSGSSDSTRRWAASPWELASEKNIVLRQSQARSKFAFFSISPSRLTHELGRSADGRSGRRAAPGYVALLAGTPV